MVDGLFYFADTMEPTVEAWEGRPCGHCGLRKTPDGHDGCLGTLPGVVNACCGHGTTMDAYVQYADGADLRGAAALAWMDRAAGNT